MLEWAALSFSMVAMVPTLRSFSWPNVLSSILILLSLAFLSSPSTAPNIGFHASHPLPAQALPAMSHDLVKTRHTARPSPDTTVTYLTAQLQLVSSPERKRLPSSLLSSKSLRPLRTLSQGAGPRRGCEHLLFPQALDSSRVAVD